MPYYYRRGYRRRWRIGRRYRRRLYRRSYARRYVNGSSRSSIRCKCVVTGSSTLSSGYGDTLGTVFQIQPLSALVAGTNPVPVVSNPLFQAYQNLYEEMKMIGMKVQISVTDQIGGPTLPSLQIYTAWDRRHGQGEAAYTASAIKNSASSNIATALNNNVAKLSRSLYASDLIEKAQWFDSTPVGGAAGASVSAWVSAAANPNFFCPAFFMCFGSPSLAQGSQVASVHFSISVTYYIAFRNPKYGGSSSSKDLPARSVTFADDDDGADDDDMLDLGGDYVPPALRDEDEPAGAARAAAEPASLERRQRSAGLQANQAAVAPIRKKKNA